MGDSGTQVLGPRTADVSQPRVQDALKSALANEVSARPGHGGQFGDCTDAQFSDVGPFGDVSV
jgi:hypothetical protein